MSSSFSEKINLKHFIQQNCWWML